MTALYCDCTPQRITQFQKVEQLVASNSYRQASQHPQLCPLSQSSSSKSAQMPQSSDNKESCRLQRVQPASHSEEMPWHVVAAEGEPQFPPVAHTQSVGLHMALYQGCEGCCSGTAVLSLAIAGEFAIIKQTPVLARK